MGAVLSLAAAGSSGAGPPGAAPSLDVQAPQELARQAAAVRGLEGGDWSSLLTLLGLRRPGPPIRVVLAPEGSRLAANVASWVSGYAVPELDTIVLFPARVPSYPDGSLEALVRHEVAHMLLARAAGGAVVPRWFDEGVATVAARQWGIEDGARVVLATIGRGPRSLGELNAGFSGNAAAVARSYAVSAALVRYLLREHGEGAVGRILAAAAGGSDFEQAFRTVVGEDVHVLARGYFRRETFWTTWVPFATSTTVLWMAITALALLAIKRRRERDAEQRERWALEEAPRGPRGTSPGAEDDPTHWN
jgi:hypothetical protein